MMCVLETSGILKFLFRAVFKFAKDIHTSDQFFVLYGIDTKWQN